MRLLVTRPEPDGEHTAQALRARGHEVLAVPLIRMEAVDFEIPDGPYSGMVMTSANAARALARHPQRGRLMALPTFTVGRHTAQAARAAGIRDIRSADGNKDDLVRLLAARRGGERRPLLYLAGEDRAGDLDLTTRGVRVVTAVVYRAVKAGQLPPAVVAALAQGRLDGVLHFSRRSAEAYLDCARAAGALERALAPLHFCLSQQVSEPLAAAGAAGIRVAQHPDETALIELVGPG